MYFKFLQRRHGRSGLSPEGGSYSRLPAELDWFDVAPLRPAPDRLVENDYTSH